MNVFAKAFKAGLIRPENRGMSAKQLRAANPELAGKLAKFITANRRELIKEIAKCAS